MIRTPAGAAAGLVVSACLCAGCAPASPTRDPQIITVAVRTGPNTLDPRLANDEATQRVAQLVFSPLFEHDRSLAVRPALALRIDSPDPRTYVVHLRHGVRFHDGRQLTARDVVHTFTSILDPALASPFRGAFRAVQSVVADGDHTVRFTLREPFPGFPGQLVGVPPIVPAGSGGAPRLVPIGTGPYRVVRYAPDDRLELSAYAGYWDGVPDNAGLVIKVVPDDTMRGLELLKGSSDLVINDLPPDLVFQFERTGGFTVNRTPGLDFSYVGFNLRDPVLSDVRVRHAIGYAINRDAIIRYLRRGLARPASGLIPDIAWAYEPDVFRFTYDPNRARRLLDEAGYPDPDGEGPRTRLRLSFKTSTAEESRLQATAVQHDLARVGIDLDVRAYEFATFFADVLQGNFQLFSLQWVGGAMVEPDILRRVFHSAEVPPAGFNRGHYANAEVDRLLDEATSTLDEEARRHAYAEAQRIIARDAPYIPIWSRTNVIVARPSLAGLHINPVGDFSGLRAVRRIDAPHRRP